MLKKIKLAKTTLALCLMVLAGHSFATLSAIDLKNFGDNAELRFGTVTNF